MWGLRARPVLRPDVSLLLASFAATYALSLPSPFTQWPHHAVLAVVFLAMAVARVLDELPPRAFAAAGAAVGLVWLALVLRLPRATPLLESSFEKDALLRFVRAQGLDRRTLQVHTSWGTYYIAQLFGDPARAVVYLKALPDDERRLRETRRLADEIGRPLLLVSSRRRERFFTRISSACWESPTRSIASGTGGRSCTGAHPDASLSVGTPPKPPRPGASLRRGGGCTPPPSASAR